MSFPAGERHCRTVTHQGDSAVFMSYEGSQDLIDMMMAADALKSAGITPELFMPYFPCARQDRRTEDGEAFGASVIVNMIAAAGYQSLTVFDPHSDVIAALCDARNIKLKILSQADMFQLAVFGAKSIKPKLPDNSVFIAPDAGGNLFVIVITVIAFPDSFRQQAKA